MFSSSHCHHCHSSHPRASENRLPWPCHLGQLQVQYRTHRVQWQSWHVRWWRCLTPDENEPRHSYFTNSFFVHDAHCEIVHLVASQPHSPQGSGSLASTALPACSLASALGAFLFLIALVTILVIGKVPGGEIGLLTGTAFSCWRRPEQAALWKGFK